MKAIEIIKSHEGDIKKRFHVKRIGVFGSHARGQEHASSDVDVLVEFERTVDFFEFLDLKEYLERLLGKEVDLVTKRALKPMIKDKILSQVVYV